MPLDGLLAREDYPALLDALGKLRGQEAIDRARQLCREDLYFLLRYALGRADADNAFVFDRCREVQAAPDGYLDLWAREHYKSTIITFALTIQDILRDPEITVGIFSHVRPKAKDFLAQIKRELEGNRHLQEWFPDILWGPGERPVTVAWSLDTGITVKRSGNPASATVEAFGLVDGQPTGKHYSLVIYDDVVTRESVTTSEMIAKVTDAWALSLNLGARGGRVRYIGTRYHSNDTYDTIMGRGTARPRIYPATHNGQVDGEPILLSREELAKKRQDMGPYIFACQMLQDPVADNAQGFKQDWLRYYDGAPDLVARGTNRYILVDAASSKKPGSDYTCMWLWGLGQDGNLYWLDGIRDRLNLTERAEKLIALHRQWRPSAVGYERYGMMGDTEFVYQAQQQENYRFGLKEVGGQQPKEDRIRRLVPWFEQGRVFIPRQMVRTDYEGRSVDLVKSFVEEEYMRFPVAQHDDMLDASSRLFDIGFAFPEIEEEWRPQRRRSGASGY